MYGTPVRVLVSKCESPSVVNSDVMIRTDKRFWNGVMLIIKTEAQEQAGVNSHRFERRTGIV